MNWLNNLPPHLLANQDPETLRDLAAANQGSESRNEHEHDEQAKLFQWAKMQECVYPELAGMFAVPNGGHRHPSVGAKLKAEGVKAGVPDVWLPVARSVFHGFVCEMKWGKNQPSEKQEWWIEFLRNQNYYVCVCWSFEEAKNEILGYLENSEGV